MPRHASQGIVNKIEGFEGFRSHPYQLGDGVTTIGYGETQGITMSTPPWSQAYAEQRLKARLRKDFEPYIHRLHIPLNQHQFDALLSAIYNLGPGILDPGRSLGNALRSPNRQSRAWIKRVQAAILLYDMPGTPFHEGLKKRREWEAALFGKRAKIDKKRLHHLQALLAKVKLTIINDRKRKARIERQIKRLKHNV